VSPEERILAADGIHNFRDYGGYRALGGSRLKRGTLFRSAQHKNATDSDLRLVLDSGIRMVIDLRGDAERASHPCRRHADFAGKVVFVTGETVNPVSDLAPVDSAESAAERMRHSYTKLPFRPLMRQALAKYFEALLDAEGGSLVHCLAGKDRTGIAVALFHHMLGVHPDDLMADYVLTNEARRNEAWLAAGAAVIRARNGPNVPMEAVRMLMSADPSFLDAAFGAIRERFGTIDAYVERDLGMTPAMRGALADKYLA
jgi:protein tyrosine/serine phosphatase